MEDDEFLNSLRHCLVNYQITSVEASCPEFKVLKGFNINTHATAYLKVLKICDHGNRSGSSSCNTKGNRYNSASTVFYSTNLDIVQKENNELINKSSISKNKTSDQTGYYSLVSSKEGIEFIKILNYLNHKVLPKIIFNQTFKNYLAVLVELPDGKSIRFLKNENTFVKFTILNQFISFLNYIRSLRIDFFDLSLDDFVYEQDIQLKINNTKIMYNGTSNSTTDIYNSLLEEFLDIFFKNSYNQDKGSVLSVEDLEKLFSDTEVAAINTSFSATEIVDKLSNIKDIICFNEKDTMALEQFKSTATCISKVTRLALDEICEMAAILLKTRNLYEQQSATLFVEVSNLLSNPGTPSINSIILPDLLIIKELENLDIHVKDLQKLNDPNEIIYYLYRIADSYIFKHFYKHTCSIPKVLKGLESIDTETHIENETDATVKTFVPISERHIIKHCRKEMNLIKKRAFLLAENIKNYKSLVNCFSCKAVETSKFFEFKLLKEINLGDLIKMAKLSKSITQVINEKVTVVDRSINLSTTFELSSKKNLKIWLNEGLAEDFIFFVSEVVQSLKN